MKARHALTLIELIVCLSILIALSGIVIPLCSEHLSSASQIVTRSTLADTAQAIERYWHDTKLVKLDGVSTVASEAQRFNINWLFKSPVSNLSDSEFDPNLRSGWNGPYVLTSTALTSGSDLIDAWNHSLVVQYVNPNDDLKDVRIVSAGPNGVVEIPSGTSTALLSVESIGDDIYVAIMLR
jgi:type II secretory pathway pseudopilin PulG